MRLFLAAALAALTISCSDDQDPMPPTTDESTGDASTGEDPAGSSEGESTGAPACAPGAPCDPAIAGVCGTLMKCLEIDIAVYACILPCSGMDDCVAGGGGFCTANVCKNGDAYAGKCYFE